MNASIKDPNHASIIYYDGDYPSKDYSVYPENYDAVVTDQGIADDVERYIELAKETGDKVLELCCGTGRVAVPLVMNGFEVTAVDLSTPLLNRFRSTIASISNFPHGRLTIEKRDVTTLDLAEKDFDMVVLAFNSLLCIPDFHLQQQVLRRAAEHLREGGLLALDIWNPWALNLDGDQVPESYFTRRRPDNGNRYTRFAATGPMNSEQVQPVYGWYDETGKNGHVKRTEYHMEWRVIFRYEIELMLANAGFSLAAVYGGNHQETFEVRSMKMFIEAVKKG